VRQGMEETQAVHKQEIQEQVAAHKTAQSSLIGSNHEYKTLPSPAQHAACTTLRNEIATMIINDLGVNTADERWSRLTKHMTKELDREIKKLDGDGRVHCNRTSHNGKIEEPCH
jgi:N-methylhydantoinase B/oxoprolinase/acetone carboxylase alpha subunit